jgi:hypothetical protein
MTKDELCAVGFGLGATGTLLAPGPVTITETDYVFYRISIALPTGRSVECVIHRSAIREEEANG